MQIYLSYRHRNYNNEYYWNVKMKEITIEVYAD